MMQRQVRQAAVMVLLVQLVLAQDTFNTADNSRAGAFVDIADPSDVSAAPAGGQPEGKSLEDEYDEVGTALNGGDEAPTENDATGREEEDEEAEEIDGEEEQQGGDDDDLREGGYKVRQKVRRKPVFVPVPLKVKKKKDKIINIAQSMYIPGGQPLYGKFKSIKACAKACSKNPACFAADYDKWLRKCFIHSNLTACGNMLSHPSITHLSKIPCFSRQLPTARSRVVLGSQMFYGYEQKGIDDLKTCIKKCTLQGGGIAATNPLIIGSPTVPAQLCVAINFDFSKHKCFFFPWKVNGVLQLCSQTTATADNPLTASKYLVANPYVITIFLCPGSVG